MSDLYKKLPTKNIKDCSAHFKRVLEYDPSNIESLFIRRPFERFQNVSILQLFPLNDVFCACGCGQVLPKNRKRWATEECSNFAVAVRYIIYGNTQTIGRYLRKYYGWKCKNCGDYDKGHDHGANGVVSWIKVDHILPVKLGGGGGWLSNYQLLCHKCHVKKTKKDFNWKGGDIKLLRPSQIGLKYRRI